jgi:hypothetical protein
MHRSLFNVFTALLLLACGGPLKYEMTSTPKAPGADAKLIAKVHEAQHQTEVELEVKNLPPPERVIEGGTDYVAWSRKNADAIWNRVGSLKYEPSNREASLNGSVAEIAFEFRVTAEKASLPASPSDNVVFQQRVSPE